jgi:hypothetical protein
MEIDTAIFGRAKNNATTYFEKLFIHGETGR